MSASDTTVLVLRNGQVIELPRRKIGELKDARGRVRPQFITDFSSIMGCQRCDGIPGPKGKIDAMAGMLWVVQIDASNIWHTTMTACNCVFGAWRHARGLEYADDLKHIPPGLSAADWRVLAIYGRSGMGWTDILRELPERERINLGPPIQGWLAHDPPAYDPYPDKRHTVPEQAPGLEGRRPEEEAREVSGQAEAPF